VKLINPSSPGPSYFEGKKDGGMSDLLIPVMSVAVISVVRIPIAVIAIISVIRARAVIIIIRVWIPIIIRSGRGIYCTSRRQEKKQNDQNELFHLMISPLSLAIYAAISSIY
jgi:hypothetical protein